MTNITSILSTSAAKPLRALLDGVVSVEGLADLRICDLTIDSREATPGCAFVALAGAREHGLAYAAQAIAQGAVVVLHDGRGEVGAASAVPVIAVPNLRESLGLIADRFFDCPSKFVDVVGVTGTNGKTTTAWLIADAIERLGSRAAYAGTLGVGRLKSLTARSHTTPDSITIHRELASMHADGVTSLGMEVSSHALDQSRVAGVRFEGAVFTNLTHDHLDYHGSLEAYGEAKAKLFSTLALKYAVINADDEFGRGLIDRCASTRRVVAYSKADGHRAATHNVLVSERRLGGRGLELKIDGDFGSGWLHSQLIGDFNIDNLLATLGVLLVRGVTLDAALGVLRHVTAPPGRMQTFAAPSGGVAVVDYAHTPDALGKALTAARAHTHRRLICVFGCGGDRDATKRPVMGRIASELADAVIVTDDNPRQEDGNHIVEQIMSGIADSTHVRVERDRGMAIRTALADLQDGDVVLVAGKGHEDYQIVGTERRHFSDAEVIRASFEERV